MRSAETTAGEVLVIDDNPESLRLLSELLRSKQYVVRQASDGNMALKSIKLRQPDIIILDIAMPDMDGFKLCSILKSQQGTEHIPVVFCSAMCDQDFKQKAFSSGGVDFINKPFNPHEVLLRLNTHLELNRLRVNLESRVLERTSQLDAVAEELKEEIAYRKNTEKELRIAAKAFEASYSGIVIVDGNQLIVAVNPAFCRITGYQKHELLGCTLDILKSGRHGEEFYLAQTKALDELGVWSGEVLNRCKDGNVIPMLQSISVHREKGGQLSHYICTLVDISESKNAQTLIEFLTHRDPLTGLANRMAAKKHFELEAMKCKQKDGCVALVLMDLDRFKLVNDSLGHGMGDQLLNKLALEFNSTLPENYLLSRSAGDEFLIVSAAINHPELALSVVDDIFEKLKKNYRIDDQLLCVTTSMGIAFYPEDGSNFNDLLKCAENALYEKKKQGGDGYALYVNEMTHDAQLRMQVETCLRNAIQNDGLQLVYQPKIEIGSGKIVGAEALVRWKSPVLGVVSPALFIPLAEESSLILNLDEWVLTQVCKQYKDWIDRGLILDSVSVNVSAMQFRRGDLITLIKRVVRDYAIPYTSLDLEITEGVLMENMREAFAIIEKLKDLGVTLSLDDFGTGYSSLSYLKKLPIDTLKIDKSFIDEIHIKASASLIAKAIINLGKNLGLRVLAEGVEHKEQLDSLHTLGCDEIQGYYMSKPLAPEAFERFFEERTENRPILLAGGQ